MTRKAKDRGRVQQTNWKRRISLGLLAIVVVGSAIGIRALRTGTPAEAQQQSSPLRRSTALPNSSSAALPATSGARAASSNSAAAPRVFSASPTAPKTAKGQLKVMAMVNGQQITRQELAVETTKRFGNDVLESSINRRLIEQACQAKNIAVTEKHIDDEIIRMAKKFKLAPDQWLKLLRDERGIDPRQYRQEIVWATLALRRLAADEIRVTPEELQTAFDSEFGPKVQVRLISTKDERKAAQLLARVLADPESFGEVAKRESEDTSSAAARGLIPPVRRHVGDPEVERIVYSLKEGQISPVIHAAGQYLIFKCERRIKPQQVAAQHVAAVQQRLSDRIRDRKVRDSATRKFAQLQKAANIVNVMNDTKLRVRHPGVAATINGRAITMAELHEESIARHGAEVLEGEITRKLLTQALKKRNLSVSARELDAEIERAALSYGITTPDGKADIGTWLERVTEQENRVTPDLYVRDFVWPTVALKKLAGNSVKITEEDLQKSFESNFGERVEVLAIVLGDQRTADKVWGHARDNPTEKAFAELARLNSIEPVSAGNMGAVPPIRRHGGQPLIEKEAFGLQPGELSGIVASGDKFIIMRCTGRTTPVVPNIDAVRDELIKDIREKKLRIAMMRTFDQLMASSRIDNFLAGTTHAGKRPNQPRPVTPATATRPTGTTDRAVRPAGGLR